MRSQKSEPGGQAGGPAGSRLFPENGHAPSRLEAGAPSVRRRPAFFIAAVLALPLAVAAQQFAVDWWTVNGGGGASTGGVYTATGTIGQPDAGQASGGQFAVAGGFWGIIAAVQTPGAPFLTITRTTTNTVIVSWSSAATGFTLQTNTTLATPSWGSMTAQPSDDGTNKFIIVSPPAGNRFFRLSK